MMENRIYALTDPRDGAVRYIGITKMALPRRFAQHIARATAGSKYAVHCWIRYLSLLGLRPAWIEVEKTSDRNREQFRIEAYRAKGARLLNCTDGGSGMLGHKHSQKSRQKMSESHKGQRPTPEQIRKIVAARAGYRHSEEAKAKMRGPKSDQHRKNLSVAGRGRPGLKGDANGIRQHPESVLRGSQNPIAKLTEEQVIEMRQRYIPFVVSTTQLALDYNVTQATVWRIVNRKGWRHL